MGMHRDTHDSSRPRPGAVIYPAMPASDVLKMAQHVENVGYSAVWIGDSQNQWREAMTLMGAIAASTKHVTIGTGVTNPVTRHPAVFASMWATLQELSGGRAVAGIGTGYTALGTIGLRGVKLSRLQSAIADLRALLAGHAVVDSTTGARFSIDYLVDRPVAVPVYIAASGPKALATAGRVADGVILLTGTAPEFVAEALTHVERGATAAGRTLADIDVVLWVEGAIDDDPIVARDRVRGPVARSVMRWLPMTLPDSIKPAISRIREHAGDYEGTYIGHKVAKPEHVALTGDDVVDMFALAGTPAEISARITAYGQLGVDQVAVIPAYGAPLSEQFTIVEKFVRCF